MQIKDTNIFYILSNANYLNRSRRGMHTVCSIFWNTLGGIFCLSGIAYSIFSLCVAAVVFATGIDPDALGLYLAIPFLLGFLALGMTFIISGALIFILVVGVIVHLVDSLLSNTKSETLSTYKEDISTMYTAHKEKWCPVVEIVSTKEQ